MCMIVLLKNDDGGSMAGMAEAFLAKHEKEGHTVTHETTTTQSMGMVRGIDVLALSGRSGCYADTKCRDVARCEFRAFDLKLTTNWILGMIAAGTRQVWIRCCETGLSEKNKNYEWGKVGGECMMRFCGRLYETMRRETSLRMSVVDYITCTIWEQEVVCKPWKEDRATKELKAKELYKTGYIGENAEIETFDQSRPQLGPGNRQAERLEGARP